MILVDNNVGCEPLRTAPDPRVVEWIDAQAIAATAASNRMSVTTRDTAPFKAARVPVIDPWQ